MHYQAKKQVLKIGVFVLSAGAIAALVWAIWWPVPEWRAQAKKKLQSSDLGKDEGAGESVSSLAEPQKASAIDWSRRLRWPNEPVAQSDHKTVPEPTMAAPSSRFQLLGTIVENGHSFAMIQDNAGNVDLQPEGGVLQLSPKGTIVAEVASKSVVLLKNNRRTELRMVMRMTPNVLKKAMSNEESSVEGDMDTIDKEPVFNSIEEELDWLNGDDFAPEDFNEMDESSGMESSLAPGQRKGGSL